MRRRLISARYVYNGLGNPRPDGAVLIQSALGEDRIVEVGDREELLARYPDARVEDAGFALAPPPVNAHTHLDLSDMPLTPGRYEDFIRSVIAHARSGLRGVDGARRGVAELLASGCDTVGDIVAGREVMEYLLSERRLRGVAYWEVIAPDPAQCDAKLAETAELLARFRSLERPGGMRVGLAPHTPHTVSAPLLRGLTRLAREMALPVAIHVAESPGEVPLHRTGQGPLLEALRQFIPSWLPSGLSPVAYLGSLGVLEIRPTLVHMVHVSEEDVALVARHGCPVVHCPRSNASLECGRFPWELYARYGVTVALGTDSRGSSPSLSVVDEIAAARELHGEKAADRALVRAAVKGGSRALGMTPPRVLRGDPASALAAWRQSAPVRGMT